MIGPKTLSQIRKEIRAALARTGQDPIDRLEELLRSTATEPLPKHQEVLESLRRFLDRPAAHKRPARRAKGKKAALDS